MYVYGDQLTEYEGNWDRPREMEVSVWKVLTIERCVDWKDLWSYLLVSMISFRPRG